MANEHAGFEETEAGSDFEHLPEGDNYIGFFGGIMPRDPDTGAPMFKERDKRDYKKGGQVVTDSEDRVVREKTVHYGFTVIWPEKYGGWTTIGTAPWKGIRVVPQEDGTNKVQVDRVGQWIANVIKWAELCGITWTKERFPVPDRGEVTDQDLLEILDRSLLERARAGRLLVLKVNESGYLNSRADNHIMPLAQDETHKVEGIPYDVPAHYKQAGGEAVLEPTREWSAGDMERGREYLRTKVLPLAQEGEKQLTLQEAQDNEWFTKAMHLGGPEYDERVKIFAELAVEGGYDSVDVNTLARVVTLVTGVQPKERLIDELTPGQLESAVTYLFIFVGMLTGKSAEEFEPWPPMREVPGPEAAEEVSEL